jgi:hypothetical protein
VGAEITICDGSPWIFESTCIVPSRDNVPTTASAPLTATICDNSSGIYVYVKVHNTGDVPLGPVCGVGPWSAPSPALSDQRPSPSPTEVIVPIVGVPYELRLKAAGDTSGDILKNTSTGAGVNVGNCLSGRRAWGLSPDKHFLAFVYGPTANANDWQLKVVALEGARDINNVGLIDLTPMLTYPSGTGHETYTAGWSKADFLWVGSQAVFTKGTTAPTTVRRALSCFRIPGNPSWGTAVDQETGTWLYLASPCGSRLAYLKTSVAAPIMFMSTETSGNEQPETGGVPGSPPSTAGTPPISPSITTVAHLASGVSVNLGSGAPVLIDDPDLTAWRGGLQVVADRLPLSTSPSGPTNQPIGIAAGPVLLPTETAWLQFPPPVWTNFGQEHWCLVAQGFQPSVGIPRTWNSSGTPGTFPIGDANSAQRNITIVTHSPTGGTSACP